MDGKRRPGTGLTPCETSHSMKHISHPTLTHTPRPRHPKLNLVSHRKSQRKQPQQPDVAGRRRRAETTEQPARDASTCPDRCDNVGRFIGSMRLFRFPISPGRPGILVSDPSLSAAMPERRVRRCRTADGRCTSDRPCLDQVLVNGTWGSVAAIKSFLSEGDVRAPPASHAPDLRAP